MDDYDKMLGFFGDRAPGRVLDLPCGTGELARRLLARGFREIVGLDIAAEVDAGLPVEFIRHDLNEPLPLPDASFAYVFCREGLEHLSAPWQFLGEVARVLAPGGVVILSTPNILSLDARLNYLRDGYFTHFRELRFDWRDLAAQGYQGHISPIYAWQLFFFLTKYGLTVTGVSSDTALKERRWVKRGVKALLAWLVCREKGHRSFGVEIPREDLWYGSSLIVVAVKQAGGVAG